MEDKIFLKILSCLFVSIFLFGIAYAGNILIYEEIYGKTITYIAPLGSTGLKEKEQRLFPGWSPDKKFILALEVIQTEG